MRAFPCWSFSLVLFEIMKTYKTFKNIDEIPDVISNLPILQQILCHLGGVQGKTVSNQQVRKVKLNCGKNYLVKVLNGVKGQFNKSSFLVFCK